MSSELPPLRLPTSKFYGKAWMSVVAATIFGCFAVFAIIMGPLFLFGIFKDVHGQPATDAGIALCVFAIPAALICCLATFNAKMNMRPIIQLYRQGIEVKQIGGTSLDQVPMIPAVLRLGWSILSRQGFQVHSHRCLWSSYSGTHISGEPMQRLLTVFGEFEPSGSNAMVVGEAELQMRLESVASAVEYFGTYPATIQQLPEWDGSAE